MPEQLALNEVHDLFFKRGSREMTATFNPTAGAPYKHELVVLGLQNEYACTLVHDDIHTPASLVRVKGTEYKLKQGSTVMWFRAERVVQPIKESPLDLPVYKLVWVSGDDRQIGSAAILHDFHAA